MSWKAHPPPVALCPYIYSGICRILDALEATGIDPITFCSSALGMKQFVVHGLFGADGDYNDAIINAATPKVC